MSALPTPTAPGTVPPLREGDRLTWPEFERRYDAMPDLKKAELIDGVVYMGSPVSTRRHGTPHTLLLHWLASYWVATPGTLASDNSTVILDDKNVPQPVAFLMVEHQGQAKLTERGYVEGGPELVAEIAGGRTDLDLGVKKNAYRRAGIREYVVWCVKDGVLDWFALRNNRFVRLKPGADGLMRSVVFPGLWLDPAALLRVDGPEVMRALALGLASAEHAAFVARLQQQP